MLIQFHPDEPTQGVDNAVIDALTSPPATDNLASAGAQTHTLKVDGKEVTLTTDQLIAEAQKARSLSQKSSEWGKEKAALEADAKIGKAMRAWKAEKTPENYRAWLEASEYTQEEIQAAMIEMGYEQPAAPAKPTQGSAADPTYVKNLEDRLAALESVVSGRETTTMAGLIQQGIGSDPYIKQALEGLDDGTRDARMSLIVSEATRRANEFVRKQRDQGKPWDPSEDRNVAGQAVAGAVEVAKKLGLGAPTHVGRAPGGGHATGGFLEPPKDLSLKDTPLADLTKHVGNVIAHQIAISQKE